MTSAVFSVASVAQVVSTRLPIALLPVFGSPPPQAAAAGFTVLAFFDDFTSSSTVTGTGSFSTHQAGINWYPGEGKTLTDPTNYHMLPTTKAAAISNGNTGGGPNASPAGGIIQITGISTITNQGDLCSVPSTLSQTPGTIGGFGPTGYWEGYMQYVSSDTEHIAFWTLPLALATSALTELDIVEMNIGGTQANMQIGSLNQWTANFGSDVTFTTLSTTVPKSSNWHTFGMRIVATTGGQGTMTSYLDNVAVGSITVGTGTSYPNVLSDPSGAVTRYFILGKDSGATVINIDWVRYWGPGASPIQQDIGCVSESLASLYATSDPFSIEFSAAFGGTSQLDGYSMAMEWLLAASIEEDAIIPFELAATSMRDLNIGLETSGSPVREDAIILSEGLATSRLDTIVLSESQALTRLTLDAQTPLELVGISRRADYLVPAETTGIIRNDGPVDSEYSGSPRLDVAEAEESNAMLVVANGIVPDEWLISAVRFDIQQSDEWAAFLRLDAAAPAEWTGTSQRADYTIAAETTGSGLRYDLPALSEWLIALRADITMPDEALVLTGRFDAQAPFEASAAIRSDGAVSIELPGSTQRVDWTAPLETSGVIRIDRSVTQEASGPSRGDVPVAMEQLITPSAYYMAPSESLAFSRWDISAPLEINSLVIVALYDNRVPIEWSGTPRADAIVTGESASGFIQDSAVSQEEELILSRLDQPVPTLDATAVLRSDSRVAEEVTGNFRSDGAVVSESAASLRADVSTPLEAMLTSGIGQIVPSEVVGTARRSDYIIASETTGNLFSDTPVTMQLSGALLFQGIFAPLESVASDRFDITVAGENSTTLVADNFAAPNEWLITARLDYTLPPESLVIISRQDVPTWLEINSLIIVVRYDDSTPIEWSGPSRGDAAVPSETIGSLRLDTQAAQESLGAARSDEPSWVEWSSSIQLAGYLAPAEHTISVRASYTSPSENLLVARLDVPTYIETANVNALIFGDWASPIEWGINAQQDASAPAELLAGVSYLSLGPFEWTGTGKAATPFGPATFTSYAVVRLRTAKVPPE